MEAHLCSLPRRTSMPFVYCDHIARGSPAALSRDHGQDKMIACRAFVLFTIHRGIPAVYPRSLMPDVSLCSSSVRLCRGQVIGQGSDGFDEGSRLTRRTYLVRSKLVDILWILRSHTSCRCDIFSVLASHDRALQGWAPI